MRAILTYHSIDPSGSVVSVAVQTLRRHLSDIEATGIEVLAVPDLFGSSPSSNAVAITFDDGFVNFRDLAWPLLQEASFPVLLFVPTDYVGKTNGWSNPAHLDIPNIPLLDWDSLATLAEEGVELGSHSRSHKDLRQLSDAELEDEMLGAAERIEAMTGARPRVFAYPYGLANSRTAKAAGSVYEFACTSELRPLHTSDGPYLLPRLDAYYLRYAWSLRSWDTLAFRFYLQLRAAIRRLRARN